MTNELRIEYGAIEYAYEQGQRAFQGAKNPYSQREGESWHVENQDQLFDAWSRGYRDVAHAEPEFDRINHGPFEHPVSE